MQKKDWLLRISPELGAVHAKKAKSPDFELDLQLCKNIFLLITMQNNFSRLLLAKVAQNPLHALKNAKTNSTD